MIVLRMASFCLKLRFRSVTLKSQADQDPNFFCQNNIEKKIFFSLFFLLFRSSIIIKVILKLFFHFFFKSF